MFNPNYIKYIYNILLYSSLVFEHYINEINAKSISAITNNTKTTKNYLAINEPTSSKPPPNIKSHVFLIAV